VRVRLTRKLANEIDGVNLADNKVGEVIDLPDQKGRMLVAEDWAILERRSEVLPFRRRKRNQPHRRADDDIPRAS
jgi:hypothetical protein